MKDNFAASVALVLKSEGGYGNNPHDPGGETNFGISKRAYPNVDIKHLTVAGAETIYRVDYWNRVHGDDLPAGVDYAAMDFAVNSGVGRAVLGLQSTLGIVRDGVFGPVTLAAAKKAEPVKFIHDFCLYRLKFLRGLDGWADFGVGWTTRVNHLETVATAMATKAAT